MSYYLIIYLIVYVQVQVISIGIRSRAFVNNFTLRRTSEPYAETIRRSQASFTLNVGLKDHNLRGTRLTYVYIELRDSLALYNNIRSARY